MMNNLIKYPIFHVPFRGIFQRNRNIFLNICKKILVFLFLSFNLVSYAQIEWKKEKVKCPVCGVENTFYVPEQYRPNFDNEAQFQYVLFPYTDFQSVYCCISCKYTSLMEDFASIDTALIRKVSEISYTGFAIGKIKNYTSVNITERLIMAELTYQSLNKDDEFWCMFYRICAFHFEREDFPVEAKAYRQKALELSLKLLQNPYFSDGREKEFMFIAGSMYHKLNEVDSAYKYIREASLRNYAGNSHKKENVISKERLLTQILSQYSSILRKERLNKISKK